MAQEYIPSLDMKQSLYFWSAPRRIFGPFPFPFSLLSASGTLADQLDFMPSDSFFWVDDHDIQSIDYRTPNLWFPAFVNGSQAAGGTITGGVAGAKASFNFTGQHAFFAICVECADISSRFRRCGLWNCLDREWLKSSSCSILARRQGSSDYRSPKQRQHGPFLPLLRGAFPPKRSTYSRDGRLERDPAIPLRTGRDHLQAKQRCNPNNGTICNHHVPPGSDWTAVGRFFERKICGTSGRYCRRRRGRRCSPGCRQHRDLVTLFPKKGSEREALPLRINGETG